MRNFKVVKSSNPSYINEKFSCRTEIRRDVYLPFTEDVFRCFMFNGLQIKLVNGEKYILANLA